MNEMELQVRAINAVDHLTDDQCLVIEALLRKSNRALRKADEIIRKGEALRDA